MYANELCLQVAHLYQWLYFYIYVIKSKTYMKQEGVPLNTDIYGCSFDVLNCYSVVYMTKGGLFYPSITLAACPLKGVGVVEPIPAVIERGTPWTGL